MLSFFRYHIGKARFVPLLKDAILAANVRLCADQEAASMALWTYQQFLEDEDILYGDRRYSWDREGAAEIVEEYWLT